MLLKGFVDIYIDRVKMVTLSKLGASFGEVALRDEHSLRMATVISPVHSSFLKITRVHY